jgi:hypothetical protein
MYTQYFSKWRKQWIMFTDKKGNQRTPHQTEIDALKKFHYKLK